jgi:hypothetical protein
MYYSYQYDYSQEHVPRSIVWPENIGIQELNDVIHCSRNFNVCILIRPTYVDTVAVRYEGGSRLDWDVDMIDSHQDQNESVEFSVRHPTPGSATLAYLASQLRVL